MTGKPLRYGIVGMKHCGQEAVAIVAGVPHHHHVRLIREPNNRFDSNAVQVWIDGRHVGYVPASQNAVLAKFIDDHGTKLSPSVDLPIKDNAAMAADAAFRPGIGARIHRGNSPVPLIEIA